MNFNFRQGNSSARPLPVPMPVRNPVMLALFWLSKTSPRLVSVCSFWAIATQAALGFFVLLSSSLAFLSAYYTLSTLNVPSSLVTFVALGYSAFILACDREIVGSLDKKTAIVRPFLAFFISALIAIPVELFIFQARVDQELQRQYLIDNKPQLETLHAEQAKLNSRRSDLEGALAELRNQESEWGKILDSEAVGRAGPGRTGLPGAGPVFQNAQAQQASVRERIQEVRRDLDQMDESLKAERQHWEVQFQREEVTTTKDFVSRYEALDKVIHSSDALYRLSWIIWAALLMCEMTGALLKILTPAVDYHHLVQAEIRENVARIDEISDRNYRLAMENPEIPRLSVPEKFMIVQYTPVSNTTPFERKYETKTQA